MQLSLDPVRPNRERIVYGRECQPHLRKGGHLGFDFWAGGPLRDLKKNQGAFSAMFHDSPPDWHNHSIN